MKGDPILNVDRISFSAGELKILSGLSCVITQGETVGVIGPNGCGKTTFFNCLSGFNPCDSGTIVFRGKNITGLPPHKRSVLGLGRVFQNSGIFRDMSLLENVVIALESRGDGLSTFFPWSRRNQENFEEAMEYLRLVRLDEKAHSKAGSLSGGQMRLLEIVRTLAFKAELFLLDEPTSGVSPRMKDEVAELINRLREMNKTILIIEHDMAFIQRFVQRILVMDEGTVIIDDTPDNVRADPRLQEIYFGNGEGR